MAGIIDKARRGWARFWALPWKWKAPAMAVVAVIVIAAGASGSGDTDEATDVQARPDTTETATAEATEEATPEPTEEPTKEPTPATLEERIAKSYRDNRNFMDRAVGDPIEVYWEPETGTVRIDVFPKSIASAGDSLTIGGHSAIVASRAIWTTYPEVQRIVVRTMVPFTDASGASSVEPANVSTILRATGEQFVYDGLKNRAYTDNKLWFCGADAYHIHPAIWRDIEDKGCLIAWGNTKLLP